MNSASKNDSTPPGPASGVSKRGSRPITARSKIEDARTVSATMPAVVVKDAAPPGNRAGGGADDGDPTDDAASALAGSPAPDAADARRAVLTAAIDLSRPFLQQRDALMDEFTSLYLDALLAHTGGNQTAAAQIAGLDRTYLGRLMARLGKR